MAARKVPKKRLLKYVNIKIGHRFLVHIMFKVSSIDIQYAFTITQLFLMWWS